jgi:hypothetical protein
MPNPTQPPKLRDVTLALLRDDPRSVPEIHRASDGKFPFYWLKKMREGRINDPGVNRTQALYEFLAKKKLPL